MGITDLRHVAEQAVLAGGLLPGGVHALRYASAALPGTLAPRVSIGPDPNANLPGHGEAGPDPAKPADTGRPGPRHGVQSSQRFPGNSHGSCNDPRAAAGEVSTANTMRLPENEAGMTLEAV